MVDSTTEVSISVAARGLQVAATFGRSGRGPMPGPGNPVCHHNFPTEQRAVSDCAEQLV